MGGTGEVVLITGAGGFIGTALGRRLLPRYTVVGLDRRAPPGDAAGFPILECDLTQDDSVRDALRKLRDRFGQRVASVVHLAAYYDLSGEPNPLYESVTIGGTERLLRLLREGAGDLRPEQFVFTSTMLVHAPGWNIDEDSPIAPSWPYPESKARTEEIVRRQHGQIPAVIFRPAGVYDDMCRAAFLAQQIARIYENDPTGHLYPGDPSRGQAYLHLDDLLEAMERAIARRHELPPETTLLLGEPETPSYDEVQRRLGRLIHGEEWETWYVPKPVAKAGAWAQDEVLGHDPFIKPWMVNQADDHFALDISRARRLLGWAPRHSLVRELPRMVQRLREDPVAWYKTNKLDPASVAAAEATQLQAPTSDPTERTAARRDLSARERQERERTNWAHLANIGVGLWLLTSPFVLGLFDPLPADLPPPPAAGRELWPAELRNAMIGWSDIVSGLLVILFSALSLSPRHRWAQWANGAVGTWLLFAPLVFWSPGPAALANDTLAGALVIAFALLVPQPPGPSPEALADRSEVPRGWTYSPSTPLQRVPLSLLALVGLFISRYLAAYQMGHTDGVWDPIFGDGSEVVVTSAVSRSFPIADAGLGAAAYTLEVLTALIGDRRRWRTMPWLSIAFGMLVVPLAAVSVVFIMIQPVVIGTWCFLCLVQAAAMVLMIPYAIDEPLASIQFLLRNRRAGKPVWRALWRGGTLAGGSGIDRSPSIWSRPSDAVPAFLGGGVTLPPTLAAAIAIGALLMLSRLFPGNAGPMADSDHLVGCLVVTIAVTALADVARAVRFLLLPLAIWLVAAPFLLDGVAGTTGVVTGVAAGVLLGALALPRGPLSGATYGGWNRAIV